MSRTAASMVRTLVASMIRLRPVSVVAAMMLVQILGVWTY